MQSKRSWNDADDGARLPRHDEPLANHIPVRSELSLPQAFRDQRRRGGAAAIFLGSESAPKNGLHAKNREESRGNALRMHIFRLTSARDAAIASKERLSRCQSRKLG